MSWSLSAIGRQEDLLREIEKQSAELTGPAKEEFDQAAAHLSQLVALNVGGNGVPLLQLNASG